MILKSFPRLKTSFEICLCEKLKYKTSLKDIVKIAKRTTPHNMPVIFLKVIFFIKISGIIKINENRNIVIVSTLKPINKESRVSLMVKSLKSDGYIINNCNLITSITKNAKESTQPICVN
jgi:hypothetical protein